MAEKIEITPYDTPWEIACMIINAEHETTDIFNQKCKRPFFSIDDLQRIGEHIVNFCKTEYKEMER